jgi:hypothetical protein
MNGPEDISELIESVEHDDRLDRLERRVVRFVLRQHGKTAKQIEAIEREIGPAFGPQYLNDSQLVRVPVRVVVVPNYDLGSVLSGGPSFRSVLKLVGEPIRVDGPDIHVVFSCYKLGLMVGAARLPAGVLKVNLLDFVIAPIKQFGRVIEPFVFDHKDELV